MGATPDTTSKATRPPAQRTFFAVALQLGRMFPLILLLLRATSTGETRRRRHAALAIADAVLDGARSRANRRFAPTLVDQQVRASPLRRLRPSRPGRTPQALAARLQGKR
jgi:hypothetical protein